MPIRRLDFGGTNPFGQGTYFRRVRMYMSGDVYGKTTFKIQLDFASSQLFKDVYVGLKKIWGSGGTLLSDASGVNAGIRSLGRGSVLGSAG